MLMIVGASLAVTAVLVLFLVVWYWRDILLLLLGSLILGWLILFAYLVLVEDIFRAPPCWYENLGGSLPEGCLFSVYGRAFESVRQKLTNLITPFWGIE